MKRTRAKPRSRIETPKQAGEGGPLGRLDQVGAIGIDVLPQ